jgi:hypothetical protein
VTNAMRVVRRAYLLLTVAGLLGIGSASRAAAQSQTLPGFQMVESSIDDIQAALAAKQITCRAVIEHHLTRIDTFNHYRTLPARRSGRAWSYRSFCEILLDPREKLLWCDTTFVGTEQSQLRRYFVDAIERPATITRLDFRKLLCEQAQIDAW